MKSNSTWIRAFRSSMIFAEFEARVGICTKFNIDSYLWCAIVDEQIFVALGGVWKLPHGEEGVPDVARDLATDAFHVGRDLV